MKRQTPPSDRPSWDAFFMNIAIDIATRASCRYVYAGAVLVRDNRIIATGYNGAAPNVPNCIDAGCRKESKGIEVDVKGKGECRGTHAEMNALQYGGDNSVGSTLYSVLFPCNHCAKQAASAKIARVVFAIKYKDADPTAAMETLVQSGIKVHFFSDLSSGGLEKEVEHHHRRIFRVISQGK